MKTILCEKIYHGEEAGLEKKVVNLVGFNDNTFLYGSTTPQGYTAKARPIKWQHYGFKGTHSISTRHQSISSLRSLVILHQGTVSFTRHRSTRHQVTRHRSTMPQATYLPRHLATGHQSTSHWSTRQRATRHQSTRHQAINYRSPVNQSQVI